jgi:hypothetical protein
MTLAQYGTSAHTECSSLMKCDALSIGKYCTGDFRKTFGVKDCMTVKIVSIVSNELPDDTNSCPRRIESSATPL